jgi:predicted permease
MTETFAAQYAEHGAAGRWRLVRFLWGTTADMVAAGLRERFRPTVLRPGSRASWGDSLAHDLRFAARMLRKSPGFSAAAVLTLGLGIGGATALFSVVEGVLLRPLPYGEPDRLVQLWQLNEPARRSAFSHQNFTDVEERARSFEALAAYRLGVSPVSIRGQVSRVTVTEVSDEFFDVLGVEPTLGRRFLPEELSTSAPVMVVDDAFWRTELGAGRELGAIALRIGDRVYTIVGVLPAGVAFPWGSAAWIPRETSPLEGRTGHNWQVVGRIAPGVELESARAELSFIAAELKQRFGEDTWMTDAVAVPLHEQLVGWLRPMLLILLGAAGFLLVVACANVMSLMLARGASRRAEVAIRQALGAGRARLAGQFLTEAFVLSLAGGVVGLILAHFGVQGLLALEPGQLPRADDVGVNGLVLAFALVVSFLTAATLGLMTSSRAAHLEVHEELAEAARSRAGGVRTQRIRKILTSLQVAMTLVLLVGASLLARSFLRLSDVDPGYRTSGALVVDAFLPDDEDGDPVLDVARTRDDLIEATGALPGVSLVGLTNIFPLGGRGSNGVFIILDRPDEARDFADYARLGRDPSRTGEANYRVATADYFRAMGIPLLRGRLFDERDGPDALHAAVISESLAERRWPGEEPIGKLIQYGNMDADMRAFTIVGVVADVRERGLDTEPLPTFYGNAMQRTASLGSAFSLVLVAEDPAPVAPAAQAAVRRIAPDVPVRVRTLEEILSASLAQRRFSLVLLAAFAAVAVVLAVTGIYGVISYLVTQQSREWAIRLALGASRGDVLRRVLGGGVPLIGIGVLVGTGVALAATRALQGLLYGVSATDVPTFLGVALLLVVVSLMASYFPAARATRVDPSLAMRE